VMSEMAALWSWSWSNPWRNRRMAADRSAS
jgi:hypothetical protein